VLGAKLSRLSLDSDDSSWCPGISALQTCICPCGKAFAAGRRPMRLLRRDMEHDSFKRRHRVHCGLSSAKVHFSFAEWHRSHALRTMSTTRKGVTEKERGSRGLSSRFTPMAQGDRDVRSSGWRVRPGGDWPCRLHLPRVSPLFRGMSVGANRGERDPLLWLWWPLRLSGGGRKSYELSL
jgi:hypothetical protein